MSRFACRSGGSNAAPPAAAAADVVRRAAARGRADRAGPEVDEATGGGVSGQCLSPPTSYFVDTDQVQQYWCRPPTIVNGTVVDGEYNEGERALALTGDREIQVSRLVSSRL